MFQPKIFADQKFLFDPKFCGPNIFLDLETSTRDEGNISDLNFVRFISQIGKSKTTKESNQGQKRLSLL